MPRIAVELVRSQISSAVAEELRAASPADSRISRADQSRLPADLAHAVEEVRTTRPGGHVTSQEAQLTFMERVARGIAAVNEPRGSGRTWLSKEEIEALQRRDPSLGARTARAYDILAAAGATSAFDAGRWQADLGRALSFDFEGSLGSEGAVPMSVVRANGPFATVDAASVKRAFGHTADRPEDRVAREETGEKVLDDIVVNSRAPAYSAQQKADARKIVDLLGQLQDLKAFVIGDDATMAVLPMYLVGLAPDGALMGLKTGVVWT